MKAKRVRVIPELKNSLLGPEDIERHAVEVAKTHQVGRISKFPGWLLRHLNTNYQQILAVYQLCSVKSAEGGGEAPIAEWLLDNFYLIEEQLKDIKHLVSEKHYTNLPLLKNEHLPGYPRVYALALDLVSNTDGMLDEKVLLNYLQAYQSCQVLLMGELWAVPVMLRIALMERISKICAQLQANYGQWDKAEVLSSQILSSLNIDHDEYQKILAAAFRHQSEASPALVEMLVKKLRRQGRKTAGVVGYLEELLAGQGSSVNQLINQEHQMQAACQVAMGNAITSLRLVATTDWNEIFETLSRVEQVFGCDPTGIYAEMDFDSRDYYRHRVEKLARFYAVSELAIAEAVLNCAQQAAQENCTANQSPNVEPNQAATGQTAADHVGYYLLGSGRKRLEQQLGRQPHAWQALGAYLQKHPFGLYFSALGLFTAAGLLLLFNYASSQADLPALSWLGLALLCIIPLNEIAVQLVNLTSSLLYSPAKLPKLELKTGIPAAYSTMVIVPTLLPNEKRVKELLEKLELYYLANQEGQLYFALVGDFGDADCAEKPEDNRITTTALQGIHKLNQQYPAEPQVFYYFHRKRQFNEAQQKWLGWERKRGAVLELNELLSGSTQTSYQILSAAHAELPKVRYIITLDADTYLPMGMAKRLIGTMAHPLNQPVIDSKRGIVTKGHGLLQPRIGISMDSANKTMFSRIFAGQGGIDPYTTAVSDVYQDLFGEGIFAGKGIYELATFQKLLKGTIPENSVLSHDLLEGSYVRAGLVNDLELIDGYPARYNAFTMRQHRWVRGDWQLLPWLAPQVKDQQGRWRRNPLSALSRWKIFDNLRRSMLNPALLVLTLGAFLLPGSSFLWLGLVLLTQLFPTLTFAAAGLLTRNSAVMEGGGAKTVVTGVRACLYQAGLQMVFLAYQAVVMVDAISRSLVRVLITRKNLLEWIPAADLETNLKHDLGSFYRKMKLSPLLGLVILGLAAKWGNLAELAAGIVIALLWLGAPYLAFWISLEYRKKVDHLKPAEQAELRRISRKTWAYFEDLVTAAEHYLPPDNFQVDPLKGIAHRTSPTNIGLGLIGALAARDFGYLGTTTLLEKIAATTATLEQLEKWEGHLYNWYNTLSLEVLRPRYVSTVDSGNFVGYLMVVVEGLKAYLEQPLVDLRLAQGLLDTLNLVNEEQLTEAGNEAPQLNVEALLQYLQTGKAQPQVWLGILEQLAAQLNERAEFTAYPWGKKLQKTLKEFQQEAADHNQVYLQEGYTLVARLQKLIEETKFKPLFNPKRQLFSIGFNVEEGQLTKSYYDLLASEARLASYIAIARGEVSSKHWFRLGRKLTQVKESKGLVSWTGTMFEYLMPPLIMKNFENSLLDATYSFVVKAQKLYGSKRKVPWGISESAYYAFDTALNYQYKAFGVPELGLKRGLGNELVIAPYATVLALNVDPKGAMANLARLKPIMDGEYGLYEAIDYTSVRRGLQGDGAVVKNFMVHHQGMSILALANYFFADIMQRRFHRNPVIKSAEILLQERMPFRVGVIKEHREHYRPWQRKAPEQPAVVRKYGIPQSSLPAVHLLANENYAVMLTAGGSGYSKYNDLAVARWKEGQRQANLGFYLYVQNINANNCWTATFEPFQQEPEDYRVVFSPDQAEYFRKDGSIETHTQVVVAAEDNLELRKVTLTNNSKHRRILEITSYLEVVLTHPEADLAHPAFSNLFVTTEYVAEYESLLAVRRPRSVGQKTLWAVHSVAVEGEEVGSTQYETDRAKFIGRNRSLADPLALEVDQPLSNSVGAVLDPIMSIRKRIKLEPGQTARVTYCLGIAEQRGQALALADKYHDPKAIERAFEFSWNRSQIEADYLDINAVDLELYQNLTAQLLFTGSGRRTWAEQIKQNTKTQPGLWPFGISGDLPVLLLHLNAQEQVDLVYQLLKAHEFWRLKGLRLDLVLLADDEAGYTQPLQDSIREAIASSHARELLNRSGGVYLLTANQMAAEEITLLYTVARVALLGTGGSLAEQLASYQAAERKGTPGVQRAQRCRADEQVAQTATALATSASAASTSAASGPAGLQPSVALDTAKLLFYNGLGGFNPAEREYVIVLQEGHYTPAPWINVIANPSFGFNVSEVGAGYTWSENSRENKLTPWYNDPVTDRTGEVIYLRDEQTKEYWSITPMPIREKETYYIRHGHGYTVFEHCSHQLEQQLVVFAAVADSVKLSLVKLKNLSAKPRKLTATYYLRPVLGVAEKNTVPYITTQAYGDKAVLLLANSYNTDFPCRLAFVDTSESKRKYTGDAEEFLGSQGDLSAPAALEGEGFSPQVGAGYDPCAVMQVEVELAPGATKEFSFLFGQGKDLSEVNSLIKQYSSVPTAQAELSKVKALWQEKLGMIQVTTPDPTMDLLLNGWLQYQVIACRVWSRAAYYQSGGAYGFRDQLQDVMAVAYTWPELTRKQILLHAAHQFLEGDVQHWWHPGADKGIRTRYSDDLLWLPYVTADYIQCTADWSILAESASFLEEEPLPPHEDERYNVPRVSNESADIYEHCLRAIERALKFGEHGLPLMGSGDWNDGMNTVGNQGKGESVWLAWFLHTVLQKFIPLCQQREDQERVARYTQIADELARAIERTAWDGSWYRRAYFDDGTPLGSAANSECRIDAIAQSWSVISGVGQPHRALEAMQAVEKHLIDREAGIIKLLTPPFGQGQLEPGYIKSYVPGVRENGGQYTHAAVWTILGFAKLGLGDKAGELFGLINPINHTRSLNACQRYKVEPYVVAADVYAVAPNSGRGGWSWYTGAAGWMYRVGLEHILGIQKKGNSLQFAPCIPRTWTEFCVDYRLSQTLYRILVRNPEQVNHGVKKVLLNQVEVGAGQLHLVDDGKEHQVEVIMGQ